MLRDSMIFRGRALRAGADRKVGDWVYGSLIRDAWDLESRIYDADEEKLCEVEVPTVGQSTGLSLPDHTVIFEGDILDCGQGTPAMTVGWSDRQAAFMIRRGGTKVWRRLEEWLRVARASARVIGTVHDRRGGEGKEVQP